MNKPTEEQTRHDLADDFDELLFLAHGLHTKLHQFLHTAGKQAPQPAHNLIGETTSAVEHIKQLRISCSTLDTDTLVTEKRNTYVLIRELTALVAGAVTSLEWQSPSYSHTVWPEAGVQLGSITGNITDYTRDQLIVGNEYQRRFANEMVGRWRAIPIQTLLTQSGMGALTTIITFLLRIGQFTRPVLMGKNSYFQNKELIANMIPQPVIEVDEHDTPGIIEAIRTYKPSAIFLDTVCNAPSLAVPDLVTIKKYLFLEAQEETYLIIDNTLAAVGFDMLKLLLPFRGKIKLLCFESLNKYYQYGMDRTMGGFVWGLPQDASKLFYARLHAGTIMSDVSTAMLPVPNRKLLTKRLNRLERNALFIGTILEEQIHTLLGIDCVIYPKLPSHPAYSWAKRNGFTGSSITLRFDQKHQHARFYRGVLTRLLKQAKKESVPLVAGSSFGLNTTRIYVTALNAQMGEPFLRISLGTETVQEMETLTQLFLRVLT